MRVWSQLRTSRVTPYFVTVFTMGAIIAFVQLLSPVLVVPNAGVLYLLIVIASAYWLGTGPATLGLLIALSAIIYFYQPRDENLATFGVRFAIISTACVVGLLIARLARRQERHAFDFARQAERLLAQVESERARFEAVLRQMPSGVAIIEAPTGVTILTNEQLVNMWRQKSAFASSSEFGQLVGVSPDGRTYGPDDWPIVRSIRGGEIVTNEEIRFQRWDGSWGTQIISSAPVRDRSGNTVAAVAVVTEITERKTAEAERERLLAELEATLEAAAAGVVAYHQSGRIARMNAAAARIMGYSPADMELPMADLFARLQFETEDGRALPFEQFPPARALRGERVGSITMAFHRDGEKVWIYDGAGPILLRDGEIVGAVVSFADVTGLRQLQERQQQLLDQIEARASDFAFERDRLRTVLESIADAVFVCDAAGLITQANAVALAMLGEPSADAKLNLADYLSALHLRYPDGRSVPLDELAITRALNGVTERGREEVGVHPATHHRVDLLISAAPLRDADGRVVGAVQVTTDITRVRELADEAQRRAAELQAVLDNMVDAVFVCDPNGRIVLSNPAASRLFGPPGFAEVGSVVAEFPTRFRIRHPDGRSVEPSEMVASRALAGQTVVDAEQVFHSLQFDQDRHVRVSASPIRDDGNKVLGAVVVIRDVTALTELDRLKDEFLAVAAHELKTPVTIMKGYAQILARASFDMPTPARRMVDAIDQGADRINRIVQDLLDVTRLQAGRMELADDRIDLPALADGVVGRFALTTSIHRLRIVQAEPAIVRGDRSRIEEVLADLLDNAVRYSPAGGDVDVAVRVEGDSAVVSVRDQGIGIPKEKQARIFERFYRAHTRTQYDYGGMGIGLYIAREVIARHGGQMWFESEEGRGSTFCFSLPLSGE